MLIDCDSCEVRPKACGDCVVTVLLGCPPEGVTLDHDERHALDVLAASGLVPPLRLVVVGEGDAVAAAEAAHASAAAADGEAAGRTRRGVRRAAG